VLFTSCYPDSAEEGLADLQMNLAGDVLTVDFELGQQRFVAINAGPEFKFNPSVSFMVNFDPSFDAKARDHLNDLWNCIFRRHVNTESGHMFTVNPVTC
jgi:predicted 3-demethylubiquinone-9 3-methyltransferase (glyoxalase superfamily)